MGELQIKQPSKEHSAIPLSWDRTTVPEVPVTLPIKATVQITNEAIEIHAERTGSLAADEAADVHIPKEQVLAIDVILMPDPARDADPWSYQGQESYAVIRHADVYEVVPFFESVLSSFKSYWLKALAKAAKERLGVEVTITDKTR